MVKSNDFQVTVLGTEFDLLAYPGDSLVRVTLLSGECGGNLQQPGNVYRPLAGPTAGVQ